jgi:hypothetical protein
MTSILLVEYRPSLLSIREEILSFIGHPMICVLGSQAARDLDLTCSSIGVIVIGHGAAWNEREELIEHFVRTLPTVQVLALLRREDSEFEGAQYNLPADDPPRWVRVVTLALAGVQ